MASSSNPHQTGDTTEAWKEKDSGRYILSPKGLKIVWGKDPRYWRLSEKPDGSGATAELLQVSWLEVSGSIDLDAEKGVKLDSTKKYAIGLRVTVSEDAFGWNNCPVYFLAKRGKKGKYKSSRINLAQLSVENNKLPFDIPQDLIIDDIPQGQDKNDDQKTIYFGLYEIWSGKWKGGLKIHHAFLKDVNATANSN